MATFADYPSPKTLDGSPAGNWVAAPYCLSGVSDTKEAGLYEGLLDLLDSVDPHGNDWAYARFLHWETKWVEVVFYRPESGLADWVAWMGR